MLSSLGEPVDDAVIDEMIAVADTNGDGKVDFNEFLEFASKNIIDNKINENQMREAFKMVKEMDKVI